MTSREKGGEAAGLKRRRRLKSSEDGNGREGEARSHKRGEKKQSARKVCRGGTVQRKGQQKRKMASERGV